MSRGTPDAVNSGPPPRGGPPSPRLFSLRNHTLEHLEHLERLERLERLEEEA